MIAIKGCAVCTAIVADAAREELPCHGLCDYDCGKSPPASDALLAAVPIRY